MAVSVGRGVREGIRVAVSGGVRETGAGAQLPRIRVISKSEMKRLLMVFLRDLSIAFFKLHILVKSGTFSSLLKSLMLYCAERCASKHKFTSILCLLRCQNVGICCNRINDCFGDVGCADRNWDGEFIWSKKKICSEKHAL